MGILFFCMVATARHRHSTACRGYMPPCHYWHAPSCTAMRCAAGVMSALSQCYDVQRVPMVGSSGGGLVALLGACEVAPQEAVARAFALCREAGVYERPLGLFGIWRGLVHRWADKGIAARMGPQVLGQAQVMQDGM